MTEPVWSEALAQVKARALPAGGFGNRDGGRFRPDAAAWAILALSIWGTGAEAAEAGRRRLAAIQGRDGRVSLAPDHPEAFWPTPLAILAWHGSPAHREARQRAVNFLLATGGRHWPRPADAFHGHDTGIKGWPWTGETHSWAEPTSMAVLALTSAEYGDHERTREARRMLLDRQLPGGGWNYGNTTVFGQVLRPMPESTGLVLNALADAVPQREVQASLDYLAGLAPRLNTPRALGWATLGLGAWGARPPGSEARVGSCLARQDQFGGYDTVSLALLLLAGRAAGGLASVLPA
ncbi:MAG: terpene cyclase/mutase family protein, partial [Deltaproteobacteria bacterium]|nr:terpene cyclase/mutase family protein [Deltaproteobacteria bacterium]